MVGLTRPHVSSVDGHVPDRRAPDADRDGDSTKNSHCRAPDARALTGKDTESTMTTNPTTTTGSATTDPASREAATPTTIAGQWLVGEHYDSTADLPMGQIADAVYKDLYDVRNDDMLPAIANFEVSVDSDGPVPILRIGIAGLIDATSPTVETSVIYEAMRSVFGLANHYNRVNLAQPNQARFIQHITALRADGEPGIVLIGMMHDAATI